MVESVCCQRIYATKLASGSDQSLLDIGNRESWHKSAWKPLFRTPEAEEEEFLRNCAEESDDEESEFKAQSQRPMRCTLHSSPQASASPEELASAPSAVESSGPASGNGHVYEAPGIIDRVRFQASKILGGSERQQLLH